MHARILINYFFNVSEKLVNILSSNYSDLFALSYGTTVTWAPWVRHIIRKDLLQELWEHYDDGLPIEQFLDDAFNLSNQVMEFLHNEHNLMNEN